MQKWISLSAYYYNNSIINLGLGPDLGHEVGLGVTGDLAAATDPVAILGIADSAHPDLVNGRGRSGSEVWVGTETDRQIGRFGEAEVDPDLGKQQLVVSKENNYFF